MSRLVRWFAPMMVGGLIGSPVQAELTVIYDSGETRPLAPLLRPLLGNRESPLTAGTSAGAPVPPAPSILKSGTADLHTLLPVRSPGLSVGESATQTLESAVLRRLAAINPRPLFLVGADEHSLRWLATHRDNLRRLGAVGLLIQVETVADVRRAAAAAQGLPMSLASGSDLAAALGIQHYPVLITGDGLQQ